MKNLDKNEKSEVGSRDYRKRCGNLGEDIAVEYLLANGYRIIFRNFRYGKQGEIDIIAEFGDILIFIEVKTRSSGNFGKAVEQISRRKLLLWRQAAEGYMYINRIVGRECRLDLIAIDFASNPHSSDINSNDTQKNYTITHIENVF